MSCRTIVGSIAGADVMDGRSRIFLLALIIEACCGARCLAWSERYGAVPTVEWLAADADVVVRAVILEIATPHDGLWTRATARSVETIKDELPERFEFATYSEPKLLAPYHGREVLLFLRLKDRHVSHDYDPSPCALVLPHLTAGWAVIGLDGNRDDIAVTMDFSVLKRPASIMQATRAAAAYSETRPRPKAYRITIVPFKSAISERVSGFNSPGMIMPFDERLEPKAREWIKSPNPHIRLEGAVALGRFQSDANIATLKALLSDPACEGGRYLVRTGAYDLLTRWGVKCGNPVLDLPHLQPVGLDGIL